MTVMAVYGWREFWSMGEGRGAPSFFLSITSFPRRGHEMHVLMPGSPEGPVEEQYHGVTLHRMRTRVDFMPGRDGSRLGRHARRFLSYVYWFMRALPAGKALAARIRPDVIIGMGELGAPAAYFIGRASGVPNVTRLFGIGMILDDVRASRVKFMLRYRETFALRAPASYIILCDDGSRGDELARALGVDASRIMYWPNGVDKKLYSETTGSDAAARAVRSGLSIPDGNVVFLSVSRLDAEKRIDRALAALSEALRFSPCISLVVVGVGPTETSLRQLASELGIAANVIFAGGVGRQELPAYYRASDAFLAVSDRTNVSNSLHEAMISGLPPIALNTGRTSDVVVNGETGLVVEPGDVAGLVRSILSLAEDAGLRRRLGEAARHSADRRLPTIEERQDMEVAVAERAVNESSGRTR